jgi:nitrite reductase/ring-hydroxylating ferredoxin subunit
VGLPPKNKPDEQPVSLCNIADIADGGARGIRPPGANRDCLFIVRRGSTVRAYRNVCPHQGGSLPWRKDAYLSPDGSRIVCYAHGATFDIDTGTCVSGPALGQALQAIELSVDSNGMIRARIVGSGN